MQNLVVLMEPSEDAWNSSLKAGKMIFNRFCIDEDAAFELSGINYLKKSSRAMVWARAYNYESETIFRFEVERNVKGKDLLILTV